MTDLINSTAKSTELFNPLYMDITVALKSLLESIASNSSSSTLITSRNDNILRRYLENSINATTSTSNDRQQLLETLSCIALHPQLTLHVLTHFRPLAFDLIARWLDLDLEVILNAIPTQSISVPITLPSVWRVEIIAAALARVLPILPQARPFAVHFFSTGPSLLDRLASLPSSASINNSLDIAAAYIPTLHSLLLTTYRLLTFSPTFASLWNFSSFLDLLLWPDEGVRHMASMCLGIVFGLSDHERGECLKGAIWDEAERTTALMKERETLSGDRDKPIFVEVDGRQIDLRFLRLHECQTLAQEQLVLLNNSYTQYETPAHAFTPQDLHKRVTIVAGVLLPRNMTSSEPNLLPSSFTSLSIGHDKDLVSTPTTMENLSSIALATSLGRPVLLEGPTGSGKTALVEHLARATGNYSSLVKIYLADQTDSKVLLGTYVATARPGEFRWQPGVLTCAVREGHWVLIEDIDLAPTEVISVLLPVLEGRWLFLPGRGERVRCAEGFRIFATRNTRVHKNSLDGRKQPRETMHGIGAGLWTRVVVQLLNNEELRLVIDGRFPNLCAVSEILITVFSTLQQLLADPCIAKAGCRASARDLFKWCVRINALTSSVKRADPFTTALETGLSLQVLQDMLSEAADCFCGMIADWETQVRVLESLGAILQVPLESIKYYLEQHKPGIEVVGGNVRCGRATLTINKEDFAKKSIIRKDKKRPFAITAHASRLLERIAVCVHLNEPVLLVGETGTGKTTVVQQLADMVGRRLNVINLSQQSDSSDIIGGFKPVDERVLAVPLKEEFDHLFERTFSVKRNSKFLEMVRKCYIRQQWSKFIQILHQAVTMSETRFEAEMDSNETKEEENDNIGGDNEQKSQATKGFERKPAGPQLRAAWKIFAKRLDEFESLHSASKGRFVFSFLEGALVKAVRQGDWILLDEINLASTETLECLSGLLQDTDSGLLLSEKGNSELVRRHPNFRIFACMNPATDIGKRDLPPGLRSRFTEFYVYPPDSRRDDLLQIVRQYLSPLLGNDGAAVDDVTDFYLRAKTLSQNHRIADGANQPPHFSMRTLSRALTYVVQISPIYGLRRALYEGFSMTFLTQLGKESEELIFSLVYEYLLRGVRNSQQLITQIPKQPGGEGFAGEEFILFGSFWLQKGPFDIEEVSQYIRTPSVEKHLSNLARVVMSGKFPVLIQGPTSSGKTSMIEYLAKRTGHRFVRINNHEHTDLQEYLGTYISNTEGSLIFQEGVLVEALRKGYWIVLDELNLAPSDVLEALNRLLDDNRELLIPETQEVIRPHPHFMLFATQNPAGLYGGRKALSRAFRNRFLELHFDDIPEAELEEILSRRCQIAPSYCKRLIQVYKALMERRQNTRIFEQRHGFITLRDLFRWAGRGALSYQELAEHGYMILAERCRREEEKVVVKEILENVMKAQINEANMYNCENMEEFTESNRISQIPGSGVLVWTKALRRLFTLVAYCLRYNEPVLLVGETGCGKTTICQLLASAKAKQLHIVNCHQNTETADLLGGQRPVRNKAGFNANLRDDLIEFLRHQSLIHDPNLDLEYAMIEFEKFATDVSKKDLSNELNAMINALRQRCRHARALFEWHDGPLVQAMRNAEFFLLDEISLADDSVLERLNSVLEPHRLLVLAEKGGTSVEEFSAKPGFQFFATMNPGGDYGKKELSPALRNRFTEIWVPLVTDKDDLLQIIDEQLRHPSLKNYGQRILDFTDWYTRSLNQTRIIISLRDILAWVDFMNITVNQVDADLAFVHGGCLVLLDSLGSSASFGSTFDGKHLIDFRHRCLSFLSTGHDGTLLTESDILGYNNRMVESTNTNFGVWPFYIPKGVFGNQQIKFTLLAPTTLDNTMRVLRAMQVKKPILLEGSPGVGKTSLISALAVAAGCQLIRINLSEQTDLMDLFGSDLPVEGGSSGEFAWRDAPFLQAMKAGDWVLLDELNLASQSVLEGLNSVLDHRGVVYVPELDREFFCAEGFRVFGAQNPLKQGGGRKGLPKSFVNRFSQVYVQQLSSEDLLFICAHLFPSFDLGIMQKMIEFNSRIYDETMVKCSFGHNGSPWEFNLRDVFRWLELLNSSHSFASIRNPAEYLDMVYLQRMRTKNDREQIIHLFNEIFDEEYVSSAFPYFNITSEYMQIGHSLLHRKAMRRLETLENDPQFLQYFLSPLETLMKCVEMNWLAILTGPSASGKTSVVRVLADMTGNILEEFAMNSSVDTMELLGGFEQVDTARHWQYLLDALRQMTMEVSKKLIYMVNSTPLQDRVAIFVSIKQLNDGLFTLESRLRFSALELDNGTRNKISNNNYASANLLIESLQKTITNFKDLRQSYEFQKSLNSISQILDELIVLEKAPISGRFEWVDGILIRALENGHWLLIDNANLCNPSVLDRLNPLFEPDGTLMVNERGLVDGKIKIIKPHPNFRVFMTVNPRYGELSRAMRNRGIEIALVDDNWLAHEQDMLRVCNSLGLRGSRLPILLSNLHAHANISITDFTKGMTSRDYILFVSMIVERLQRGEQLNTACQVSFHQVYGETDIDSRVALTAEDEAGRALKSLAVSANLEMISPTNYPQLLSGRIYRDDSLITMITLQGSYFIYLLQRHQRLLSAKMFTEALQTAKWISASISYFVENTTIRDLNIRLRWLDFLAIMCDRFGENEFANLKMMLISVVNSPIAIELKHLRGCLGASVKLDQKFVEATPFDVRCNTSETRAIQSSISGEDEQAKSLHTTWLLYQSTWRRYNLLLRLVRGELAEKVVYQNIESVHTNDFTLVQQSFAYHHDRLTENQLLHPIIAFLTPLLVSIRSFILSWLNTPCYDSSFTKIMDSIDKLLDRRDTIWDCVQSRILELGRLLIAVKMFKKSLYILEGFEQLDLVAAKNLVEKMTANINLSSGKMMKLLWQRLRPATLSSQVLINLEEKLGLIALKLDPYAALTRETLLASNHPVLSIDLKTKLEMVEALASLYFLDNKSNDPKYLQAVENLSDTLRQEVEGHIAILGQNTTRPSQWEMASVPLADYLSIKKEMAIIAELQYLCASGNVVNEAECRNVMIRLQQLRDFSLTHTSRPPSDFKSHQRAIWTLEKDNATIIEEMNNGNPNPLNTLLQDILFKWHERLWDISYLNPKVLNLDIQEMTRSNIVAGPSNIFQCVETSLVLNVWRSLNNLPVRAYTVAIEHFKRLQLYLASKNETGSCYAFDVITLVSMLEQMILVQIKKLPSEVSQEINTIFTSLNLTLVQIIRMYSGQPAINALFDHAQSALLDLVTILSNLAWYQMSDAAKFIAHALKSLTGGDQHDFFLSSGKARVLLSLAFVSLYIPDYPFDPSVKSRMALEDLNEKSSLLEEEISARRSIEGYFTGADSNATIQSQLEELKVLKHQIAITQQSFSLRPQKSQLNDIFTDLRYLQQNVIEKQMKSIVRDLDTRGTDSSVVEREQLLQENFAQFIHRLSTKYPMYRDILQPLLIAVQELKYGLRLMTSSQVGSHDTTLELVISALLDPADTHSISSSSNGWILLSDRMALNKIKDVLFMTSEVGKKWTAYLHYLIVVMQRVGDASFDIGHLPMNIAGAFGAICDEIVEIWIAAEEHTKRAEIEKETLYKRRTINHQSTTDEQLNETDFQRTFSNYTEEFADFLEKDNSDQQLKNSTEQAMFIIDENTALTGEDVREIVQIHRSVFCRSSVISSSLLTDLNLISSTSTKRSYDMTSKLAMHTSNTFSEQLDTRSYTEHLLAISGVLERFSTDPLASSSLVSTQTSFYDFYQSENVKEAKRMFPVVDSLRGRVIQLLELWPEHAILQQLVLLCDRLMSFPITSPIAKLLTGIELLLQKSEDWEAYASRDVSIQTYREAIIGIIVSWRQLEINCWPKLLAAQDHYYEEKAYKWWFHLYNVIIKSILTCGNDDHESFTYELMQKHIDNMLSTLDYFLLAAPLGEFSARLALLQSYHQQLRTEVQFLDSANKTLKASLYNQAIDILENIRRYYTQFQESVKSKLEQLRLPIERDLRDFLKIASWKDVNIHALKQSAQKTHRQLYKCVRKYQEILAKSTMEIVTVYQENTPIYQSNDEKTYHDTNRLVVEQLSNFGRNWVSKLKVVDLGENIEIFYQDSRFVNLSRTLTKFQSYCQDDIFVMDIFTSGLMIENFVDEIINRIKTFQKETPPVLTPENKSFIKNQKLMKKKALVDFLKVLKRIGLNHHCRNVASKHQNASYVFGLPAPDFATTLQIPLLDASRDSSFFAWSNSNLLTFWNKADDYYYRLVSRMIHLRKLSQKSTQKDLTLQEVEKGMGFSENLLHLVMVERSSLCKLEGQLRTLFGCAILLEPAFTSAVNSHISLDYNLVERLPSQKNFTDKLMKILRRASEAFAYQIELLDPTLSSEKQHLRENIKLLVDQIGNIQKETDLIFSQRYLYPKASTGLEAILTSDVTRQLDGYLRYFQVLKEAIDDIILTVPESRILFTPLLTHLSSSCFDHVEVDALPNTDIEPMLKELNSKINVSIDEILLSVQTLRKERKGFRDIQEHNSDTDFNIGDGQIRQQHDHYLALVTYLRLENLAKHVTEFMRCIGIISKLGVKQAHDNEDLVTSFIKRFYPFLQQHLLVAQHILTEFIIHHKSITKFAFIMCSTFTTIFTNGFCMPEGAEELDAEGDMTDIAQGTGIGDGDGNQDISEQIEDEEQILGTQNEEVSTIEKKESKKEEKGIEMENDFEGDLEDIEKQAGDEAGSEDGKSEASDIDEDIGNVDDKDEEAIDEKMWNDDDVDDLRESDKATNQNQSSDSRQNSEIVAKDSDSAKPPPDTEQKEQQSIIPDKDNPFEEVPTDEDELGAREEGDIGEQAEQLNTEIPEAETLELPEDMSLDNADAGENQDDLQEDDEINTKDMMDVDKSKELGPETHESQELDQEMDGQIEDEMDRMEDDTVAELEEFDKKKQPGDESEDRGEDTENDEKISETADRAPIFGDTTMEEDKEKQDSNSINNREQPNSNADAENEFGAQGQTGKPTQNETDGDPNNISEDMSNSAISQKESRPDKNKERNDVGNDGSKKPDNRTVNNSEKENYSQNDPIKEKTNSHRSLGDALENWRRRLTDVKDAEEDSGEKKENEVTPDEIKHDESNFFEYVKNDENAHDLQTMSSAEQDQVQRNGDIGAIDDELVDENEHTSEMDIEFPDLEQTQPEDIIVDMNLKSVSKGTLMEKQPISMSDAKHLEMLTTNSSFTAHQSIDQEDIERMRQELEINLTEWRDSGRDVAQARELWQKYENLTHDLAFGLCEQLRLILEPTLATRMQGDYRTGKRLNMKKIIPYIASQFKKDKIWLRRTKPSKRQYQIMIAVDDSKSMSGSHSIQLAYEALALISKALSQLEAGDISVVSFGERVKLLHPFDQPFTGDVGASVIQQFTFDQSKTYVDTLLETSIKLFEHARSISFGSRDSDLWQLQLIISDGICEDHEGLRALLRQATELRIMIIFIIVDNKPEKASILTTSHVKWKLVDGKHTMCMESYLSTFPFSHYLILRDINALPEVLADALRQYFSFVTA